MAIKRITISVPEEVARRIKRAAGATPVSAWVTRVVEDQLYDVELERQWRLFYDEVGLSRRDVQRATGMLERLTRAKRRGRKAAEQI